MVFLFGWIIIFIYTIIAFAVYRDSFKDDPGLVCTTMYECFLSITHRGLIVGMYEVGLLYVEHVMPYMLGYLHNHLRGPAHCIASTLTSHSSF